ncbi:hypothetical protein [Sporolactobacillus terrae]|uniref:Uncharacterized protein n=1 Tax=Sporolactobacillus terrae TaxID=269673 RepID=A0A5K7WS09_9BACL|nr:hypothetical protein [Sporolactobacillus terrae]BBN97461.1 hypothetical protein St703_01660 [Sporolactobacillus terrae]
MAEARDPFEETHRWSNKACLGYAILAADRIGLTEEQEHELLGTLQYVMDMNTIEKAEQTYLDY